MIPDERPADRPEDRTYAPRPGVVPLPASCLVCRSPVRVVPGIPGLTWSHWGGCLVVHACCCYPRDTRPRGRPRRRP